MTIIDGQTPLTARIAKPRKAKTPKAPKAPPPTEATPLGRTLFANLARPFIIPAKVPADGLQLIFDIEADGLLETASKAHCIVIDEPCGSRVHEYGPDRISEGLTHLAQATTLIGHNAQGYDLPVLHKLYGWSPPPECRVVDTLIAGRLILANLSELDGETAKRTKDRAFGRIHGKHSLEAWGVRLGAGKIGAGIEVWKEWTPEIQARCVGDVEIGRRLWLFLQPGGYSRAALDLEHTTAAVCERITMDGAPFDAVEATRLCANWKARRAALEAPLRTQFPKVTNLNSRQQLGALLESRGWRPEKPTPKTNKPCIDDAILEALPDTHPEFEGLAEHYVLGRRLGQLANGEKAWLNSIGADGRIHGGIVHIGTPHSRAKHLDPNLAQVPNHKKGAPFAAECRALFRPAENWVFVTCDQANLQDRAFAHYLAAHDGGAFAQTFAAGIDQHWRTAIALGLITEGTARDKTCKIHIIIREGSKTFRYAFLFGAGALRAGNIIAHIVRTVLARVPEHPLGAKFLANGKYPGETVLRNIGKRALERFIAATPGLRALREKLSGNHRRFGWIEGLDGRRVPTGADYKALNRIVTAAEAIICKHWLIAVYDELRARFRYGPDGDVYLALWVHDELAAICRPEIAEQVGKILVRHACSAGSPYGFRTPLAADFQIGRDWAGAPLNGSAPSLTPADAPLAGLARTQVSAFEQILIDAEEEITEVVYADDL
jgi:hypothetical protein